MIVVCLLIVGAVPATARAQDDFDRYLTAAVRLYKSLEYERAMEQIQRAKRLAKSLGQDVSVALYEGIILADMGKREDSLVAFKTALLLDPKAKLPIKVSPKMARDVEEVRALVRAELAQNSEPAPPAAPAAPTKPPANPAQKPAPQALARKEPAPPPTPTGPPQPEPQPTPSSSPQPASPPAAGSTVARRSPLDGAALLQRVKDDEARLRATGNVAETHPALVQLKEIRELTEQAGSAGQRMNVSIRLDQWERQYASPTGINQAAVAAAAKQEPQAEPVPTPAVAPPAARRSPLDRAVLLQRLSDDEAQLRHRDAQADLNPAMVELEEIQEQMKGAVTSGQRMAVSVRLDKWERQALPSQDGSGATAPAALDPKQQEISEITTVVKAHRSAVMECMKKQPDLGGKLVMRWSIEPNGSAKDVTCVSGALCSTYAAGCLAGLLQGWTFPAGTLQGRTVEFPFVVFR